MLARVEGIEPSLPALETGGVTVRYTRMHLSLKPEKPPGGLSRERLPADLETYPEASGHRVIPGWETRVACASSRLLMGDHVFT